MLILHKYCFLFGFIMIIKTVWLIQDFVNFNLVNCHFLRVFLKLASSFFKFFINIPELFKKSFHRLPFYINTLQTIFFCPFSITNNQDTWDSVIHVIFFLFCLWPTLVPYYLTNYLRTTSILVQCSKYL